MKIFRSLIIGFMIGGAFGAKFTIYISQLMDNVQMDLINAGLLIGGMIGVFVVVATSKEIAQLGQRNQAPARSRLNNTFSYPN